MCPFHIAYTRFIFYVVGQTGTVSNLLTVTVALALITLINTIIVNRHAGNLSNNTVARGIYVRHVHTF